MTYTVNPQVLINDVEYKDKTIQGITLTNGRTTVDEQPRAGFATIILVTPDNTNPSIEIDYKIVVKVDDSSGTDVTLWTGWVSDIESSIVGFGSEGRLNQQKITAIGSLAKLNRRLVGAADTLKKMTAIEYLTLSKRALALLGQNTSQLPILGQMLAHYSNGKTQTYLLVT
jgi:hypothetical protein